MSVVAPTIRVKSVIGTGDPFDILFVIPLIHSHGYPPNCCFGELMDGANCERKVQRLLVLEEPFQGHELLSACEAHFKRFDRPRDYAMDPRD